MKKDIEINLEIPNGRLRLIRLALGISQKDLADLSFIPLSTINKIEQNKFAINPDNAHKLSKALKLESNWLMNGIGEPFSSKKVVFLNLTSHEVKKELDYFIKMGTIGGKSLVNAYLVLALQVKGNIYFVKTLSYEVDHSKPIYNVLEFVCGEDFLRYFKDKDVDINELRNKLLTLDPDKKMLPELLEVQSNNIICKSSILSAEDLTFKSLQTLIVQEDLDIRKVHKLINKNKSKLKRPS